MSIDQISISSGAIDRALQSNGTEDVRSTSQSRQPQQSAVPDDAISLSDNARDVGRLANLVDQSSNTRLDAVREALANGTYKVSGANIASKLIDLSIR